MSVTGWGGAVTLTVEVAFSGSTYVDITQWVRSVDTDRGFSRETSRWQTGTGQITLSNSDGRFSPNYLGGPYVVGGVTGVRPWRPVRVSAVYGGTTYRVFTGYAISWLESYPGFGSDNTVTVGLVDEFGKLAGWNGSEQSPQGSGESTGARITRILVAAGNVSSRSIAVGVQTVQSTTLAQNAIQMLDLTADSEGGWLWCDSDGTVVFEDGLSPVEATRMTTSQATFGEFEVRYVDIALAYDGDRLVNMAALARAGGTAQSASDSASRALYGDRQFSRSDLISQSDPQVMGMAQLMVAAKKDPKLRIVSADFAPMGQPSTLWVQALGRRMRDLVTVKRRPTWSTVTQMSFIEGVSHSIRPEQWSTQFRFADAAPWSSFTTAKWNTATWDSGVWFY